MKWRMKFGEGGRSGGANLLSFAVAQILFETERVHGGEPRLLHALYPQHHPTELLTPRHHAIQLVQARPDLQLKRRTDTCVPSVQLAEIFKLIYILGTGTFLDNTQTLHYLLNANSLIVVLLISL